MATIKATVFFEKRFWVATFERTDKKGYALAKHIFGKEPSDPEIYNFVLNNYKALKFGEAKTIAIQIKRKNPKRVQREVRREMEKVKETTRPATLAQDYMREELEKKKKQRKNITKQQKQDRIEKRFALKQEKKKQKKRGK